MRKSAGGPGRLVLLSEVLATAAVEQQRAEQLDDHGRSLDRKTRRPRRDRLVHQRERRPVVTFEEDNVADAVDRRCVFEDEIVQDAARC